MNSISPTFPVLVNCRKGVLVSHPENQLDEDDLDYGTPPQTPSPDYGEVDYDLNHDEYEYDPRPVGCKVKFDDELDLKPTWRDLMVTQPESKGERLSACYRQRWAKGQRLYRMEKPGKGNLDTGRPWFKGCQVTIGPQSCYGIVEDFEWDQVGRTPKANKRESRSHQRWFGFNPSGKSKGDCHARAVSLERSDLGNSRGRPVVARRSKSKGFDRNYCVSPRRLHGRCSPSLSPVRNAGIWHRAISPGQKSFDRPPCVPGPPLKQLRSYSVDNTNQVGHQLGEVNQNGVNPVFGRTRQRSVSGHVGPKKTPNRRIDEEALKRTRLHNNQYELSQDLLDKQVEMLERKYGGVRARHAALTIQRAFRKYCMVKKFQDIANASKGSEKRLSRRIFPLDLVSENKDWLNQVYKNGNVANGNSMVSAAMTPTPHHNHHHPHYHHHLHHHYNYRSGGPTTPNAIYEVDQEAQQPQSTSKNSYHALPYRESDFYPENGNSHNKTCSRSLSMRERHMPTNTSTTQRECLANTLMTNGTPLSEHNHYPSVPCHCRPDERSVSFDHQTSSFDEGLTESSVYYTPPTRLPNSTSWSGTSGGIKQLVYAGAPSQSTNSSHSADDSTYHTPRESLSSEDSAICSSGDLDLTLLEEHRVAVSKEPQSRRPIVSQYSSSSSSSGLGTVRQNHNPSRTVVDSNSLGRSRSNPINDPRKVPPTVPKRTSSIITDSRSSNQSSSRGASPADSLMKEAYDAASLSSSGSTGSSTSSGGNGPVPEASVRQKSSTYMVEASPVWKRKSLVLAETIPMGADDKRLSNISENSEDSLEGTTMGLGYIGSPPNPNEMMHLGGNFSMTGHSYGMVPPGLQTPHDGISPMTQMMGGKQVSEVQRKRQYRVGLNLFNKKPERGVRYLINCGFLEASPQAVARFLISRKGLSKQMIGEYLGNLMSSFNMAVLEYFVQELDLAGMQVDVSLRKFQTYFRLPGEAQKIERLMEVFSHRFVTCNRDIVSKFTNPDTVFVLAFAIIMLNTDLHTPNMKAEKRMKSEDFVKNLRGVDDGHDLDKDMLHGIYERIKANEFKPGSDHVTQVLKVQQTIVGKKPNLALPHRRLVCYCRLYEVYDVSKKERPGVHQREVFLFNDMLMVTKIFSKKKNSITYSFRQSFPLCGISVTLFEAPYYPHGIRLSQRVDDKVLVTFNARNEHDRSKFVEDLKESILEMDEMENLRIEAELEKQQQLVRNNAPSAASNGTGNSSINGSNSTRSGENRDSGVADMELISGSSPVGNVKGSSINGGSIHESAGLSSCPLIGGSTGNVDALMAAPSGSSGLKRSALSNSLLDLHEQQMSKPVRRGSAGSLDSGMSISFQSSAASTVSRDSSPQIPLTSNQGRPVPTRTNSAVVLGVASAIATATAPASAGMEGASKNSAVGSQPGFLGNLFGKKSKSVGPSGAPSTAKSGNPRRAPSDVGTSDA